MDQQPNRPSNHDDDVQSDTTSSHQRDVALANPVHLYTAAGNLAAHSAVIWLASNGVQAHVIEDNSGVSLFAFGTISQFHQPQVFVDKSDLQRATELMREFENQQSQRLEELSDAPMITSECEECGTASQFPATQDGSTQNCPKCGVYMDVGVLDWPDDVDFDSVEPEPEPEFNADDLIHQAFHLEQDGDWAAAIELFQSIAHRWPEHATYANNSIANIQSKIDASQ